MINSISELTYWVTLAHAKNVKPALRHKIAKLCIKNNILLSDFFDLDPLILSIEFLLNEKEIGSIENISELAVNNSFLIDNLLEEGYTIITLASEYYPNKLYETLQEKSPIVLYVKGNIHLLNQQSIAIVGSRDASAISLEFADNIAKLAVARGKVIVSGYARGVDQQALQSGLRYGGQSIIVLPQGIQTFSSGIKTLYKEIVDGSVLVISSFFPTARWDAGLAMARNCIIYGIADEIYIAESGKTGGTWEGAKQGLDMKQNIYIRKPSLKENNANEILIENGGIAVSLYGDII